MSNHSSSRRRFFRDFASGAAVVAAGPVACAPSSHESGRAFSSLDEFAAALRGARNEADCWRVVRELFLLEPDYAYFNTGGLGPTPGLVLNAVDRTCRELELRCETGHSRRDAVHARACEIFGCSEDELAFTRSATEAMNLVARGIKLERGDQVLMTTHEHPGGALPWFAVGEDDGIEIATFEPGNGAGDTIDRFRRQLTPRTRLVVLSHVTCTHGLVLPISEIAALCRDRGIISVIDGAQAVGQIPVDFHDLGCDFYLASGHKWLLGPKGTGLLFVRGEMLERWKPSYVGAYSDTGFNLLERSFEWLRTAKASEYGTRNTPLLIGFAEAFDLMAAIGFESFTGRGTALAGRLRVAIKDLPGVEIVTPGERGTYASILAFSLPASGGNPWDWCNFLRRDHGLRLRPVGEAGLSAVRASTHVCNSEEEVDRLATVLEEIL